MKDVFVCDSTQSYLRARLISDGSGRRGIKSRFASAIQCNSAYVTRLLDGAAQLSLEQGMRANAFFGHTAEEAEFFLELIGFSRAGSKELRDYYKKRLAQLREKRATLSNRISSKDKLPEVTQATYYSLWIYAAIDIATSVPALQTADALSEYFGLPLKLVNEVLSFLSESGLVERKQGRWVNTNRSIYLSSESPHVRKHHLNWRLKAMQLIEKPESHNLHYSSVISLSRDDFEKLKEHFIQSIVRAREIVKDSRDEVIAAYTLDLFELK